MSLDSLVTSIGSIFVDKPKQHSEVYTILLIHIDEGLHTIIPHLSFVKKEDAEEYILNNLNHNLESEKIKVMLITTYLVQ